MCRLNMQRETVTFLSLTETNGNDNEYTINSNTVLFMQVLTLLFLSSSHINNTITPWMGRGFYKCCSKGKLKVKRAYQKLCGKVEYTLSTD